MILNAQSCFEHMCRTVATHSSWAGSQCNLVIIKVNHWACHVLNFNNFLFKMTTIEMRFYAKKYISMLSSLTGIYKSLTIYTQVFIQDLFVC